MEKISKTNWWKNLMNSLIATKKITNSASQSQFKNITLPWRTLYFIITHTAQYRSVSENFLAVAQQNWIHPWDRTDFCSYFLKSLLANCSIVPLVAFKVARWANSVRQRFGLAMDWLGSLEFMIFLYFFSRAEFNSN